MGTWTLCACLNNAAVWMIMTKSQGGLAYLLFFLVLGSAHALSLEGIIGDQTPPQYPIIDLHVPERASSSAVSSSEKNQAADQNIEEQAALDNLNSQMDAQHSLMIHTMQSLAAKIEELANMADRAVAR